MDRHSELFRVLKFYAKGKKYNLLGFKREEISFTGDNFASKCFNVIIFCEDQYGKKRKEVVFMKTKLPKDTLQNSLLNYDRMFDNELFTYKKILPELQAINNHVKLPYPKVIHTGNSYLIFEHLADQGFTMKNRVLGLTMDDTAYVLKSLAEYHSRSFCLESSNFNLYTDITSKIKESVLLEEYTRQVINSYWENALWCAQRCLKDEMDLYTYLLPFSGCVMETLIGAIERRNKFSVVCHGDLWCNNIMFRKSAEESNDVRLIDLQATRHASCGLDVLYLLCTSTKCGLLGEKFQELINTYYDALKSSCTREKINLKFSIDEFYEELKENISYGVLMATMIIMCCTKDYSIDEPQPESVEELTSQKFREKLYLGLTLNYRQRIRQMLRDLKQLHLLEQCFSTAGPRAGAATKNIKITGSGDLSFRRPTNLKV